MDLPGTSYCFGLFVLLTLALDLSNLPIASAEYPGVIELVGYSNRRARTHFMPLSYSSASGGRALETDGTQAPPPAKTRADIETVKQNIEKYNRLLTLDTKNLPESQKDMLQRIVERVARLKETLDIEESAAAVTVAAENKKATNSSATNVTKDTAASYTQTTAPSTSIDTETDPTLVLDETTLLHLQTSMDELAAAQAAVTAQTSHIREMPTTTELNLNTETVNDAVSRASNEDSTSIDFATTTPELQTDASDIDEQFVAARANNNNIAAITAVDNVDGSSTLSTPDVLLQQRTLTTNGKLAKTRVTKRPGANGGVKTASSTVKRGQRPNQSTAGLHKQTTTTKQKLALGTSAATTTLPLQQYTKQKQKYKPQQQPQPNYQQKISNADKAVVVTSSAPGLEERTSPNSVSIGGYGASSTNGYNDIVYDEHVNTSAIIDSLNTQRQEYYQEEKLKDKKPSSLSSATATAKPTKYHYYPHNQHIYLLPECAIQQVCNAVYVRLNYTQPLCACPSRYRDPCSASLNEDDQHTTKLVGDGKKKAITLAKTCEATTEMRECRTPKDWSLLALQNTRTGKSHYLVICRCPDHFKMEGPMAHDQPTYASVPGIRVFGMMCVKPGYSVRKPSVQPPKRYQLQKPFYRPNTQNSYINNNQYVESNSNNNGNSNINSQSSFNKDAYGRPIHGGGSSTSVFSSNNNGNNNYHSGQQDSIYQQSNNIQQQQQQHQPSYQYLNRPESILSSSSNSYRPDKLASINNFPGAGSIYGRNNEREGLTPIEAQPAASGSGSAPVSAPSLAGAGSGSIAAPAIDEDGKILISTSTQPTEEISTTLVSSSENIGGKQSGEQESISSQSQYSDESKQREKRSIIGNEHFFETLEQNDNDLPEFPWDRVLAFQKTIHWD